ncbi:MAG: hypothetical protein M3Z66_19685, partial [Chloroflexota bacterium]|nr:hypothetical protein [Chloroflexota bacterium]
TARYRARLFLRRHRTLVAGTAAVLLVLGIGVAGMAHEAGVARAESHRAEVGVDKERGLAHLLLTDYFTELRDVPGSTQAQTKAVSQAVRYLDELNRGTADRNLQLESLQAYRKMGSLLGSPYEANLGDAPGAIRTLEQGRPLEHQLLADDPRNLDYLTAAAGLEVAFGQVYLGEGEGQQALPHLLSAADFVHRVADDPHATAKMLIQSAAVYKTLADAYGEHGDASTRNPAKVVSSLQESGAFYERALTVEPHCCERGLTIVEATLGELLEDVNADQAIASYQKGLATIASLPAQEQRTIGFVRLTGTLRMHLGADDLILHRTAQGEAVLVPEFQRERSAIAADPIDTRARTDLIDLDSSALDGYRVLGDDAKQKMLLREYLENLDFLHRTHPDNPIWKSQQVLGQLRLASVLQHQHRIVEAKSLTATALPSALAAAALPGADASTLQTAADFLLELGNDRAEDRRLALSLAQRLVASDAATPNASHLLTLAEAERRAGNIPGALSTAAIALRDIEAHPHRLDTGTQLAQARAIMQPE